MTCNPFYQATRRETENARKGIQASDWLLLASTSPVSDVERGLILLRSTGAWMERVHTNAPCPFERVQVSVESESDGAPLAAVASFFIPGLGARTGARLTLARKRCGAT